MEAGTERGIGRGWLIVDLDGVLVLAHSEQHTRRRHLEEDRPAPSADRLRRSRPRGTREPPDCPEASRLRLVAAVEPGGEIRDGAWTAELDGDVLKGWPVVWPPLLSSVSTSRFMPAAARGYVRHSQ